MTVCRGGAHHPQDDKSTSNLRPSPALGFTSPAHRESPDILFDAPAPSPALGFTSPALAYATRLLALDQFDAFHAGGQGMRVAALCQFDAQTYFIRRVSVP